MMKRRKGFNTKRKIIAQERIDDEIKQKACEVRYGGNPEHKQDPGDFGLTPPSSPKVAKSLCDSVHVFHKKTALSLLKQGF